MRARTSTFIAIPLIALALGCGAGTTSTGSKTEAGASGAAGVSGDSATAKGPVSTVKVGETLTLIEDILGTKTKVDITVSNLRANVKSGNQFIKPDKGQFIVIDVTVTVKEGKFSISSSSFKLVAADSNAYNSTVSFAGTDLSASDLAPGQKSSGTVTFDAAKGAEKGGKIALTNLLSDGDAGYWTMP